MSGRLAELRERRVRLWDEMKEILDTGERNNRDLTGEENESYEKRELELSELTREIENREKADVIASRLAEPQPEPKVNGTRSKSEPQLASYELAFNAYLRGGRDALDATQMRVLQKGYVTPGSDGEARALSTTGTAGGYTIPAGFQRDLVKTMKAYGAVMRVARVISTDSGASLPYPAVNDTGNVGAILAENVQISEQDVAFTQKTLGAFMYTSKLVRVSFQLMQDSAFDIEAELRELLGERIGRILNTHFTTGAGTTEPQGLVTGGTSGVTAASATAVTSDEIISLAHSVDHAYRSSGRARFMMSDTALASIRKLKATTNEYLWQPSMQAGVPDTLFGYPVEVNQDMPAMTTGLKPIAFGDFFAGYIVREVRGIQVLRLDERYADYLQVGFFGFARYDGQTRDAGAYRLLTLA
jgi:HK97 family phage major capsid protein